MKKSILLLVLVLCLCLCVIFTACDEETPAPNDPPAGEQNGDATDAGGKSGMIHRTDDDSVAADFDASAEENQIAGPGSTQRY